MGSDVSKPVTDEQIEAAVRPLYANDAAAKMGLADDIRTARAVLAITRTPEPQAEQSVTKRDASPNAFVQLPAGTPISIEWPSLDPDSRGQAREGWKLVPVEPTADMRNAYHAVTNEDAQMMGAAGSRWAAMLAASPTPDEQRAQAAQEDVEATVERYTDMIADLRRDLEQSVMAHESCKAECDLLRDEAEALRAALAGRQQL